MIWRYIVKHSLKILFLGLLCALSVYVFAFLIAKGLYVPAVMPLIGSGLISYIFLSERRYPIRWLVPGLLFLTVMVVYPIGNATTYSYLAFADETGDIALILEAEEERILYVQGTASKIAPDDPRLVDEDSDGTPDHFGDYSRLSVPQIVPLLSVLEAYRIDYKGTTIGLESLSKFRTLSQIYVYDEEAETITDQRTGNVYTRSTQGTRLASD
jgi:maltose/maltodextrin transport system permease protein/arabinogalactan oligomer/maltooligosaccharide transport system permease protein